MRIYTTESVVYIRIHYAVYIHECVKYYNILNMCIYIYIYYTNIPHTQSYLIDHHSLQTWPLLRPWIHDLFTWPVGWWHPNL